MKMCGICNVELKAWDNQVNIYISHISEAGVMRVEKQMHEWCAPGLVRQLSAVA